LGLWKSGEIGLLGRWWEKRSEIVARGDSSVLEGCR
jgi:hypothetical protein